MSQPSINDPRKIVGCDLDDVLADFIQKFMEIAADKYGVNPDLRPTSWEWADVDMSAERVDGVWAEIIEQPHFWETLRVMPYVNRSLVLALNDNAKLYFPTARAITQGGVDVGLQSARWLNHNFGLDYPTVIVSNEKGPMAIALKYDYFIDDRPKNCLAIQAALPNCKIFMQNASHNQGVELSGIPRIQSFNDFASMILEGE